MATIVNQPPARRDFWQALKELDFLSAFFSWFFMLLTRLSEPLMLLATLYVVAEAGVPAIALPALHNLAIGIMITAPEIILPGSFVVAARTQEQGGQHARVLFAVCWLFVGLTLLTLISLFVWHFTGASLAWLMCARCSAAVGYSILMRVMSHGHNQVQMVSVPSLTEQVHRLEILTEQRMTEIEQRVTKQVQAITEQVDRAFTEHTNKDDIVALPTLLEQFSQETQKQITALAQEVKHSLETRPSRPKLSLMTSPPSITPRTNEQEFDKGAFVRSCLTKHPGIRNAEIIRMASEQGQTISSGYVSDIRKAFLGEQTA
jgi:hypothetical protein